MGRAGLHSQGLCQNSPASVTWYWLLSFPSVTEMLQSVSRWVRAKCPCHLEQGLAYGKLKVKSCLAQSQGLVTHSTEGSCCVCLAGGRGRLLPSHSLGFLKFMTTTQMGCFCSACSSEEVGHCHFCLLEIHMQVREQDSCVLKELSIQKQPEQCQTKLLRASP